MPRPSSFAQVEIETGEKTKRIEQPEPDSPFHIAILGDFTGRENRGLLDPKLRQCKPILIDRDNFDNVLAKLAPELHLPVGGPDGPRLPIHFRELDDFHPDRIFERLKIFQTLRETRKQLDDPAQYGAAAAQVREWAGTASPQAPQPQPAADISRLSASELFEQTLSATEARSAASPQRAIDDFQTLLRDIVAPYAEPKTDPKRPELVAQVDAAISGQMRALLHHPDFQALEALWRGIFLLVRRLSTDEHLKIYLLDIAKPELVADMVASYEHLIEHTPRDEPWAVLVGNYTFHPVDEDAQLLGRVAALARHASAPFLAAGSSSVLGCVSFAETPEPRHWHPVTADSWQALRRLPQATWIGLALPRFLLRLPYGKQTDNTENFAFEEFEATPTHEHYLWANPALACAYLLGEAFSESGWDLQPGEVAEISGLPTHTYRADSESYLKPCAEALLSENAAEAILDHGLMPLVSIKGSDAVRLLRFQSIAEPAQPLSGRWS